jgi:hypothetical protein
MLEKPSSKEGSMGAAGIGGWVVPKMLAVAVLVLMVSFDGRAQTITAASPDPPAPPVYVDEFELAASVTNSTPTSVSRAANAPTEKPEVGAAPSTASPDTSPEVFGETEAPYVQARKLTDFFSRTLLQMLQKSGYTTSPQQGPRPDNGVMLRGIFTEIDPMNRVRKAILGSPSTGPKFTLYVGTFNLASTDQPFYQLAVVQSPDIRFGPIITLNNYIPMAKYDLSKNPTEDDIRKICGQIVSNLAELLKANPDLFSK